MAPKSGRRGRRSLSSAGRARPAGRSAGATLHAEDRSSHTDENTDDMSMQYDAVQNNPARYDPDLLVPVYVRDIVRGKQRARLYSNPLGAASSHLIIGDVLKAIAALRASNLLEVGLVFVSEVRSCIDDSYNLSAIEKRLFNCEIGCPPLLLVCHACGTELQRLREQPDVERRQFVRDKEKEVQQAAAQIAEILLENGAQIQAADVGSQGNTALHIAASYGAEDLLSALLRMGAQISATNKAGKSAELVASSSGHTLCEQILQVVGQLHMDKYVADLTKMVNAEENIMRKEQKKERKSQNRVQQQCQQVARWSDNDNQEAAGLSSAREEKHSRGRSAKRAAEDDGHLARYGPNGFWSQFYEEEADA